jgi:hypothetical protein
MRFPHEFAGGLEAPDGSAWEIDGDLYPTNPRHLIDDADTTMVQLWAWSRKGVLPHGGGPGDYPLVMLDALGFLDAASEAIDAEREDIRRSMGGAGSRRSVH